jgi:serine/threonine protein kinase
MQAQPHGSGEAPQTDETILVNPELADQPRQDDPFRLQEDEAVGANHHPERVRVGNGKSDGFGRGCERIGPFRVVREIGRGGMGEVYEAVDDALGRHVALKVLPLAGLLDEQQVRRFRNEAAAAAQLEHPNIVPVYSVGQDRGLHYYAMQLIEGRNVAQVIDGIRDRLSSDLRHRASETPLGAGSTTKQPRSPQPMAINSANHGAESLESPLSADDFVAAASERKSPVVNHRLFKKLAIIGRDAAMAIGYAHEQGVIHRDIKPSNLLLDGKGKIWITDFGLAQIQDVPGETRTGDVVGTLRYMSPEQATGRKFLIDHRTDVYSLGVTLYELFSLNRAYNGKGARELLRQLSFEDPPSLRKVNPRIPVELEIIVGKAIAKNPQERYSTAIELASDLDRFCRDQPISARKPSVRQNIRRWINKHETLTAVIGVVIAMIFLSALAGAGIFYRAYQREMAQRTQTQEQLDRSEGLRLIANSSLVLPENPGLSLALAAEGEKLVNGDVVESALQQAMDANHELRLWELGPGDSTTIAVDTHGRRLFCSRLKTESSESSVQRNAAIVDAATGATLGVLDDDYLVTSAAFSPSGEYLLTDSISRSSLPVQGTDSPSIGVPVIWDANTGRRIASFTDCRLRRASSSCFSSDGSRIVVPGPGTSCSVLDPTNGNVKLLLSGHSTPVTFAEFNGDNSMIASLGESGEVRTYTFPQGDLLQVITSDESDHATHFDFAADSAYLILHGRSGIRAVPVRNSAEEVTDRQMLTWRERSAGVGRDCRLIALYFSGSRRVTIRDLSDNSTIIKIETNDPIHHAVLSADGKVLFTHQGAAVVGFDVATGRERMRLNGHTAKIVASGLPKGGHSYLTASADNTMRLWSVKSGIEKRTFAIASDGRGCTNPVFASSGHRFLVPSVVRDLTQVFSTKGNLLSEFSHGAVVGPALSRNRICLVNQSVVSIVETSTSRLVASHDFSESRVVSTTWVPGQPVVLVSLESGEVYLWQIDFNSVRAVIDSDSKCTFLNVNSHGTQLQIGTDRGSFELRSALNGQLERRIRHARPVIAACSLTEGSELLTVDEIGTIRIWGASDEVPERTVSSPKPDINMVTAIPQSNRVVLWHESKPSTVRIWNTANDEMEFASEPIQDARAVVGLQNDFVFFASKNRGLSAISLDGLTQHVLDERPTIAIAAVAEGVAAIHYPDDHSFNASDMLWRAQLPSSVLCIHQPELAAEPLEFQTATVSMSPELTAESEGQSLAVSFAQYSVNVCSLDQTPGVRSVGLHAAPILLSEFVDDEANILTVSWDGSIRVWSAETGELQRALITSEQPIVCADISENKQLITFGQQGGTVEVLSLATGQSINSFQCESNALHGLAFSENGEQVLTCETGGRVRCFTLKSGESLQYESGLQRCSAQFASSDGVIVITPVRATYVQHDPQYNRAGIHIWNLVSGRKTEVTPSEGAAATQLNPARDRMLVTFAGGTVREFLLDAESGAKETPIVPPAPDRVAAATFLPDARRLFLVEDSSDTNRQATICVGNRQLFSARYPLVHSTGAMDDPQGWDPIASDGSTVALLSTNHVYVGFVDPSSEIGRRRFSRQLLPKEVQRIGGLGETSVKD